MPDATIDRPIKQEAAATAEIARDANDAIQGHSRSSVVVPIDAASTLHLSSMQNSKKTAENKWTCFGIRLPKRTLD